MRTTVLSWACLSTPAKPSTSQAPSGGPGVEISARAVGGGVSASLGRGTLELDFRVSAPPPPSDLDSHLDSRLDSRLSSAFCDSLFCDSPFDDTAPLTGLVCCATSAGRNPFKTALSEAKPRRPCRFAPLGDHVVVAARLGFTDAAVCPPAPCPRQLRAPRRVYPPRGRALTPPSAPPRRRQPGHRERLGLRGAPVHGLDAHL